MTLKRRKRALTESTALTNRADRQQVDEGADKSEPKRYQHGTAAERYLEEAALAPDVKQHQHDGKHSHGARGPPPNPLPHRAAYSIHEVCSQVGVGKDKIYQAIRSGKLVARKLGKCTLITADDFHQFLESLPKITSTANPIKRARAEAAP
jgi:excisionase family DNA binding protein